MKDINDTQTLDIDAVAQNQLDQVDQQDGEFANRLEQGLVIIDVTTSGRDGEKTLANAKTLLDEKEVNSKIARKARIEWFPRSELQFKNTLETKARRAISARGVRYGRVTAIPVDELDALLVELNTIKAEFYSEVADRANRYDTIVEEHKKANPDMAEVIESLKTPKDDFFRRFQFNVLPPMAFKPYFNDDQQAAVDHIVEGILDNVAEQAVVVYDKIIGKGSMIQRTFKPIRAIREYVYSMSFQHTVFDRLVDELDEAFDTLPKTGNIEGSDMTYVVKLVHNLTERGSILNGIVPVMEVADESEPRIIDAIKDSVVSTESNGDKSAPVYEEVTGETSTTGFWFG
ncbi:DUF3150 domain-containing protein [Vibrio cyclitrophicus]